MAIKLHQATDYTVFCVEQFGHTRETISTAHNLEQTLENQILHKIAFINDELKSFKKIILMGHYVGSHICNEIMKRSPVIMEKVEKCVLMTPTMERFAISYNGRNLLPQLNRNKS